MATGIGGHERRLFLRQNIRAPTALRQPRSKSYQSFQKDVLPQDERIATLEGYVNAERRPGAKNAECAWSSFNQAKRHRTPLPRASTGDCEMKLECKTGSRA